MIKLKNAEQYLMIPTFDGSNQCIHPDILKFKNQLPNGFKYVMAFTPWPFFKTEYEIPSIVFSNDGINWYEDGAKNPLVVPTINKQYYHYSDPDIVYANNTFYLYFLRDFSKPGKFWNVYKCFIYIYKKLTGHFTKPYKTELLLMKSKDGVEWSQPFRVMYRGGIKSFSPLSYHMFSPAVIFDGNLFRMWIVESMGCTSKDNRIAYYESMDGAQWKNYKKCRLNLPGYVPWHIDVQKLSNGEYWMLITAFPATASDCIWSDSLFLAISKDGLNWKVFPSPILTKNYSGKWDCDCIYRSTFILENGKFKLWYSGRKHNEWHIGYTEVQINIKKYQDVRTLNSNLNFSSYLS